MTKTAVGYVRVSTEEQAREGYSLAAQERAIREYCGARGWALAEVYVDRGASAKSIAGRPELQRLLADANGRTFNALVVWKLDRLSRRLLDLLSIFDELEGHGVEPACIQEPLESTPLGRFQRGVLGAVAQLERETIVERTKFGLAEKARQGGLLGSLPVGYVKVDGAVLEDPEAAPRVRQLFELYATGAYSLMGLVEWADQVGFRTPAGRPWHKVNLRTVLRNPSYIGKVAYHRRKAKGEVALYDGAHPALVSAETWQRVQDLLSERRGGTPWTRRPYGKPTHPLAGIVTCGECGHNMHAGSAVRSSGTRYRYLRCGQVSTRGRTSCAQPNVRADHVEAVLAWYVAGMQLPAAAIDAVIAERRRELEASAPVVDVARIEAQMERWRRLFVAGDVDEVRYRREVAPLRAQLDRSRRPAVTLDVEWARSRLQQVGSMFTTKPEDEQRRFVHEVFSRLVVHQGELTCIEPKAAYVPLFVVDRRLRFGQQGPEDPNMPLTEAVCVSVRPRGLEPPHPAPEAGALSD